MTVLHGIDGFATHRLTGQRALRGCNGAGVCTLAVLLGQRAVAFGLKVVDAPGFAGQAAHGAGHLGHLAGLTADVVGCEAGSCGETSSGDQGGSDELVHDGLLRMWMDARVSRRCGHHVCRVSVSRLLACHRWSMVEFGRHTFRRVNLLKFRNAAKSDNGRRPSLMGCAYAWVHLQHSLSALFKENAMADDKSNSGAADRARINVNEDYELRDWSQRLGVTPEKLREAVKAVGTSAEAVREHLRSK
jgi:hypothetical protein